MQARGSSERLFLCHKVSLLLLFMQRKLYRGHDMSTATGIHEIIIARGARYGARPAFRHINAGYVYQLSYAELPAATTCAANWLREAGLGTGDLLLLCGDNSPAWALAFLAACRLGARVATIGENATAEDVAITLADLKPKVVAAGSRQREMLSSVIKKISIIALEDILQQRPSGDPASYRPFTVVPIEQALLVRPSTQPGTRSKSTSSSHARLVADVTTVARRFSIKPGDRVLALLPWSDNFALVTGLLAPLARGGTVVFAKPRSAEHLQEITRLEQVTSILAHPEMLEELLGLQSSQTARTNLMDRLQVALARNAVLGAGKHGPALAAALLAGVRSRLGGHITTLIASTTGVSGSLVRAAASYGLNLLDRSMFPGAGSQPALERATDNNQIWWQPLEQSSRSKRKGAGSKGSSTSAADYQLHANANFGHKASWPAGARFGMRVGLQDAPFVVAGRRSLIVAARTFLKIYNDFQTHGAERLVIDPPFIVAANYDSHLNALAILSCFPSALVRHVHPVAPVDAFFNGEMASLASASLLNAVPYNRFVHDEEGMRHCLELIRRAEILILFPESSVSPDGSLGKFNDNVAELAITSGCPIIPAYVSGMRNFLPPTQFLPHPVDVGVRFGLPIYPVPAPADTASMRALTARLRSAIEDLSGLEHPAKSPV